MADRCACGRKLKGGICNHCGQSRPGKNGRFAPPPAEKTPAPKKPGKKG